MIEKAKNKNLQTSINSMFNYYEFINNFTDFIKEQKSKQFFILRERRGGVRISGELSNDLSQSFAVYI